MGAPRVDVRDMLCAQALAVVSQVLGDLQEGQTLEVLFSADDVQHDLCVWASEAGHTVEESKGAALRVRKGPTWRAQ